jgi:hypothetical protein
MQRWQVYWVIYACIKLLDHLRPITRHVPLYNTAVSPLFTVVYKLKLAQGQVIKSSVMKSFIYTTTHRHVENTPSLLVHAPTYKRRTLDPQNHSCSLHPPNETARGPSLSRDEQVAKDI